MRQEKYQVNYNRLNEKITEVKQTPLDYGIYCHDLNDLTSIVRSFQNEGLAYIPYSLLREILDLVMHVYDDKEVGPLSLKVIDLIFAVNAIYRDMSKITAELLISIIRGCLEPNTLKQGFWYFDLSNYELLKLIDHISEATIQNPKVIQEVVRYTSNLNIIKALVENGAPIDAIRREDLIKRESKEVLEYLVSRGYQYKEYAPVTFGEYITNTAFKTLFPEIQYHKPTFSIFGLPLDGEVPDLNDLPPPLPRIIELAYRQID